MGFGWHCPDSGSVAAASSPRRLAGTQGQWGTFRRRWQSAPTSTGITAAPNGGPAWRTLRENALYHVILTAILGQQGKLAQASEERNWLETHAPAFLDDLRKEVAMRVHRPQDQQRLYDGLRKAGMAIPPQ